MERTRIFVSYSRDTRDERWLHRLLESLNDRDTRDERWFHWLLESLNALYGELPYHESLETTPNLLSATAKQYQSPYLSESVAPIQHTDRSMMGRPPIFGGTEPPDMTLKWTMEEISPWNFTIKWKDAWHSLAEHIQKNKSIVRLRYMLKSVDNFLKRRCRHLPVNNLSVNSWAQQAVPLRPTTLRIDTNRRQSHLLPRPTHIDPLSESDRNTQPIPTVPDSAVLRSFEAVRPLLLLEHPPQEKQQLKHIGEEIRAARMASHYSRQDFARLLNIETELVVALENGYGNLETAQRILTLTRRAPVG